MKNKILFISHDATRTGAPIIFKNYLGGLKKQYPALVFDILLKAGGELYDDFKKIANIVKLPPRGLKTRLNSALYNKPNNYRGQMAGLLNDSYNMVYGNTVVTADLLKAAKLARPNITTVCHVHELDIAIKNFFGADNFKNCIQYIDFFVAASGAVQQMLVDVYNVPTGKTRLLYESIPAVTKPVTDNIFAGKGLKICGCGTLDWRKGIDIFILTVAKLAATNPADNFHFYWIGGNKASVEYEKAIYDIKRLGIDNHLTIIESCADPLKYINACDLFLLTSREDPFPLVCLEAASLGKPLIVFKQSGGMVEFVDEETGWLVDYLDIDKLNLLLAGLLANANLSRLLEFKGKAALLKSKNYDLNKGVSQLKHILDCLLPS